MQYLFMQLLCVIIWELGQYFFVGIFTFLVCLRFKFKLFNPERSKGLKNLNLNRKPTKKVKNYGKKNIVPNDNTRWLDI